MPINNYKTDTLPSGGTIAFWENVTNGDFGNCFAMPKNKGNLQIQVSGIFDGAVVSFYGSNDPQAQGKDPKDGLFFTIRDLLTGKPIKKSDLDVNVDKNGGAIVADSPAFVTFSIEGGTDKTNLKICLF